MAKVSGPAGFEKHFALKCILPHLTDDEEFRSRFEHEARLSSQLSHPNIAQTYDLFCVDDRLWLVMEYIPGNNLRHLLQRGRKKNVRLPLSLGVHLINEVCKGLAHAHEKRIIHRDISPKNIMIGRDGSVKIIDFGIAKAMGQLQHTRLGELKGTVSYMSPEQAMGRPIDHRSDLFPLATLLWEWVSGKVLFTEDDTLATLNKVRECRISAAELSELEIPVEVRNVLERGLQRDPDHRFQSAEELHQALEKILSESPSTHSQKEVAALMASVCGDDATTVAPLRESTLWEAAVSKIIPVFSTRKKFIILLSFFVLCLWTVVAWYSFHATKKAKQKNFAKASAPAPVRRCGTLVQSHPSAAKVFVNGTYVGKTPTQVKSVCGERLELVLERSGYQPLNKTLVPKNKAGKVALALTPLKRNKRK